MGSGSEDTQSVEIDWNDYTVGEDQWGQKYVQHTLYYCHGYHEFTYSLQEAIDWALEHDKICSAK